MLKDRFIVHPSRRKGQECTRELSRRLLDIPRMKQSNTILYCILFDRGQMAHGVSFVKRNEMSLFNISVLYVLAQIPNSVVNQNSNSSKEKVFLTSAKFCSLCVRFGMYGLFLCHSRTLGQE